MIQNDVTVIGGGAAGLMAAVAAAEKGAKTVVIEHKDRAGKKILMTGNGKCNYTNALQGISYYRGENPAFVLPVFAQFGLEETLSFFQTLGIYPKNKNGYYYPASGQASSVLEVLLMEAKYRNVEMKTSCELRSISRQNGQFSIVTNQGAFLTRTIIFATGLLAYPKTGSDGSAFPFIRELGHHLIDVVPALVQLQGKQSFFKALAGIRAEMTVTLYIEGRPAGTEYGELQLTDFGISGIPVFQLSRFATRALMEKKRVYAEINFMPELSPPELSGLLCRRFFELSNDKCASEALVGLFNKKLTAVFLKEADIRPSVPAVLVTQMQIKALCRVISRFRVDITGSRPFEQAQVCAGGVDTAELHNETLESKLVKGIYFAGEVVDIDGACGGYNLQWAWSSGYVAGTHAAEKRYYDPD